MIGDLYSKSKNSSQSNFFEGLEVNDLLYVKSEINGKVTLRSKLLDYPVIKREFDSIYFENGNILARSNAKYQVYDYLLNPWRLNDRITQIPFSKYEKRRNRNNNRYLVGVVDLGPEDPKESYIDYLVEKYR